MMKHLFLTFFAMASVSSFADTVLECKTGGSYAKVITVKDYSVASYADQALSSLALSNKKAYVDSRTGGIVGSYYGQDQQSKVRFELNQKTLTGTLHTDIGTDYEDATAYRCKLINETRQEGFWEAIYKANRAGDRGESTRVTWGARG